MKKRNQEERSLLVERLKTMRDEARVQLNLAGKEARDEWKKLDKRLNELERSLRPAGRAAKETAGDVLDSVDRLVDDLEAGFHQLVEALKTDRFKATDDEEEPV